MELFCGTPLPEPAAFGTGVVGDAAGATGVGAEIGRLTSSDSGGVASTSTSVKGLRLESTNCMIQPGCRASILRLNSPSATMATVVDFGGMFSLSEPPSPLGDSRHFSWTGRFPVRL